MELDFAILATAADGTGGKINLLGGGFDTFNVEEVPTGSLGFFVISRFIADPASFDFAEEFTLRLNIRRPDNEISEIPESGGVLKFRKLPNGNYAKTLAVIQMLVNFTQVGQYHLQLLANDKIIKTFDLNVSLISETSGAE